jgi:hypothetical protein
MRSVWTTAGVLLMAGTLSAADANEAKAEFFEKKVRPILTAHCTACHSADTKPAGGLRVDDHKGLLTGGNGGPAVVPGKPAEGTLLKRVTQRDEKRRMPLEGEKLTDEQVETLTTWIKDGAVWPAVNVPASFGKPKPKYEELKKTHWAFQPIKVHRDTKGSATQTIDDLVRAKLTAAGLKLAAEADKLTLLRRVTFDLTGLPPTPVEIDTFLADDAPDAYEKLVDRLLASPRYGEHWGRHWLDVARYGESTGPSRNIPYPFAWKYRDYVIDSFNADVPFDRFIQEQVAGDLLETKDKAERDRLATATGFLALGVKDVNQRFKVRFQMDNVDEQIDVVTRGVLGLTVSCARCHDHKFDPIPTKDYYALAGIFTSTDNASGLRNQMGGAGLAYYDPANLITTATAADLPPVPAEQLEKLRAEVEEAKKAWDAIRGTPEGLKPGPNGQPIQRPFRLKYEAKQAELLSLTDPAARGYAVHGVRDSKTVGDTELRVRGEAEKLGPAVRRGFLTAFNVPDSKPVNPKESGRRELAEWLVNPNNPLTARVFVNRAWAKLFGRGIVSTVDNFGTTGDTPTHPELLDHLAGRFVADGWSVKKLVRTLVRTHTYRQSADATAEAKKLDPENKLLWRHSPRRLTAEEFRDASLLAAGQLDLTRPTGWAAPPLKMIEMRDNGPEAKRVHELADKSKARSVFLPLLRGVTPHALEAFDPVDQSLVSGRRDTTTVPTQALFVLNSPFVRRQALTLAERVLKAEKPDADRIATVYRVALGRSPTEKEVERAKQFVAEYESAAKDKPPPPEPPKKEQPKPKPKKADDPPFDPDQIDQTGEEAEAVVVRAKDARTAAWMALAQALFASGEFRFVR